MNPTIQKMLADLYALEPSLKKDEPKVIALIEQLLAQKPDTKFDAQFAATLKARILAMPSEAKIIHQPWWHKLTFPIGAYAVAGVALAVVLIVALPKANNRGTTSNNVQITHLASNAFGPLSNSTPSAAERNSSPAGMTAPMTAQSADTAASAPASEPAVTGQGAAAKTMMAMAPTPTMAPAAVSGSSGAVASPAMIVRPYFQYTFKYTGDALTLPDSSVDVLARTSGSPVALGSLGSLQFGGLNLNSFSSAVVNDFDVTTNDGYSINVNIKDGTASISADYQGMIMHPMAAADTPLTIGEMPADDQLITTAKNFLSQHGINLNNYSDPTVDNTWRVQYAAAQPDAQYVPDNITVLFPLTINSTDVYEQGGNQNGLFVNIDVRRMIVTSVSPVQNNQYQSSSYTAETDASAIIKIAEQGGTQNGGIYYMGGTSDQKTQEIDLGTPKRVYAVIWQYADNTSKQLYVPALAFPVVNPPKDAPYFTKYIVVPLAKDLLNQNSGGPIRLLNTTNVAIPVAAPAVAPIK